MSVVSENQKKIEEIKVNQFKDIDDVVSAGALLRPTLVSAVRELDRNQLIKLTEILIDCEKSLSDSSVSYKLRFNQVGKKLENTFEFAPIWRFIATRVNDVWTQCQNPSIRELSMISLMIGMLIEETQSAEARKNKKRKSA